MGESVKVILALILVVASIVTLFAWHSDPGPATWSVRVVSPGVGVLALGLILKLHFRTDAAPDYLRTVARNYFNRDGFCFAINAVPVDGVCYLIAYFQNQHDRPCVGRIAVRPASGILQRRPEIDTVMVEVQCEPAAFGLAWTPWPVTRDRQGRREWFEVGASVDYPLGKGQRLRFRDGIFLRTNSNFERGFGTALAVAGAMTGKFSLLNPANAEIDLPLGVTEAVPPAVNSETRTLWRLGDPPLEPVG